MNSNWCSNLIILLYLLLVLVKTSFGQGCDSNGPNCINVTEYQRHNAGFPEGGIGSDKTGSCCANDQMKLCQMKLSCYALNECMQNFFHRSTGNCIARRRRRRRSAPEIPPLLTEPLTPTLPFTCTGPGIFPNPDNCKVYYRCSTLLKVFYYICPGTSYFNENILKCSTVITPACREQILRNLTSTLRLPQRQSPSPLP